MQILEIFVSVPRPKYVYRRNYSNENLTNFLTELSKETWQSVHSAKCLNDKWNIFINIFTNIFILHFPYVKVNINKPVHSYYQKSLETVECKRKLDIYYILARYFPEAKVHYKTLKNQYVKLLQKSKSELIKNKIDSADNKSQAMWQIINKLTGKNNPSKIFPEGNLQSNADAINNFFINHAKNSQNSNNKLIYEENQKLKSIFLKPVTEEEIIAMANKFENKKSSGNDEIPMFLQNKCICYIAEPLTVMINNSFVDGVFPEGLKDAKVVPIYKKGDINDFHNYRPISVLSSFSKFLKRQCTIDFWITCLSSI
nr:unnamed protein product [Callosobruchus chinensis]